MTDDIRYTLCHKSGKLWCFNRLRIQTLPIILRIVGFVEKMKRQRARAHQERDEERYSIFILRPPKLVRMRVRVRIRVHVTGGVLAGGLTYVGRLSEQPHWRWPNQGAAVAKQGRFAS